MSFYRLGRVDIIAKEKLQDLYQLIVIINLSTSAS